MLVCSIPLQGVLQQQCYVHPFTLGVCLHNMDFASQRIAFRLMGMFCEESVDIDKYLRHCIMPILSHMRRKCALFPKYNEKKILARTA
ncbi:hypothetical protein BDR07DRAFT_846797 [Suillus spraguei]|nr:hypothetical protein BDR07DRAFT_846797 [Suillus spraguei]